MTTAERDRLITRLESIANGLDGIRAGAWDKLDGADTSRLSGYATEARAMAKHLAELTAETFVTAATSN